MPSSKVSKEVQENNRNRLDYLRQAVAARFDQLEAGQVNGTVEVRVSFLAGKAGKVFATVTECQPE